MTTTAPAWACEPWGAGDRIDVTDDEGRVLGYLDPATGVRTLIAPGCRDVFDDVVDFWLTAAGLAADGAAGPEPVAQPSRTRVTETRFPDSRVVRTLVIPLLGSS